MSQLSAGFEQANHCNSKLPVRSLHYKPEDNSQSNLEVAPGCGLSSRGTKARRTGIPLGVPIVGWFGALLRLVNRSVSLAEVPVPQPFGNR
jgi:hypothetical protein